MVGGGGRKGRELWVTMEIWGEEVTPTEAPVAAMASSHHAAFS